MLLKCLLLVTLINFSVCSNETTDATDATIATKTTAAKDNKGKGEVFCFSGERVNYEGKRHSDVAANEVPCSSGKCMKYSWHGEEKGLVSSGKTNWMKSFGGRAGCAKENCKVGCTEETDVFIKYERDIREVLCCCSGNQCYKKDEINDFLKEKASREGKYATGIVLGLFFMWI